ncbi:MAG: MFS transporter [Trueperaceae bacterium]|nr:MFS transporter [Trueperaceae bacterium]
MARRLPGWLSAPIVGASMITLYAGAAQFGVTAVLGDVAVAFDVATSAEVEETVGMSTGALGLGLAAIRFAGAGALFGSVIADRLGRRIVLLAAAAIGLVATGVATFMPTFWSFVLLLAVGRPLLTTTNAVVPVVASEEAATEDRTAALAYMSAMYAVGAGIVSVARSIGDGLDYRTVLLGASAMALTLPLVGRLVRDSPTSVKHARAERPRFGFVDREYVRPVLVIALLGALTNVVTGPALTFFFLFGEQVLDQSPGQMAVLVILAGPIGLTGLLAGRWAGDRIGRRTTSALGTAAAPVAAVWTYSGDDLALRVGYLCMIFFAGVPRAAGGCPAQRGGAHRDPRDRQRLGRHGRRVRGRGGAGRVRVPRRRDAVLPGGGDGAVPARRAARVRLPPRPRRAGARHRRDRPHHPRRARHHRPVPGRRHLAVGATARRRRVRPRRTGRRVSARPRPPRGWRAPRRRRLPAA